MSPLKAVLYSLMQERVLCQFITPSLAYFILISPEDGLFAETRSDLIITSFGYNKVVALDWFCDFYNEVPEVNSTEKYVNLECRAFYFAKS
jgi:hypothetical protein